jgi:hypothetical protein
MRDPAKIATDIAARQRLATDAAVHERLTALIRPLCSNAQVDPSQLAKTLLQQAFLRDWEVYDRAHDAGALDRLDRAFKEIQWFLDGRLTEAAAEELSESLTFGPYLKAVRGGELTTESKVADYAANEGDLARRTLLGMKPIIPVIRDAISGCRAEVQTSKKTRRSAEKINLRGVQVVWAARYVWKIATGKEAPRRGFNDASPFGLFLAEVFRVCKVPGKPRPAFNAWVKENGG